MTSSITLRIRKPRASESWSRTWAADITYIPIGRGFLYLVAIIDWASRCSGGGCRTRWTFRSVWRRSRRRWRVRQAGDFQHRSGLAVHLGRLHRHARRSGRRDLHGRPRKLDGQCVHRAAVAIAQVRGCLSQGYASGREAARGIAAWIAFYNDRRPHQALADRSRWWSGERRSPARGLWTCGQRVRVAHMSTISTADAASCCVIERNPEQSRFQLRTCPRRSRCAAPFQMPKVMGMANLLGSPPRIRTQPIRESLTKSSLQRFGITPRSDRTYLMLICIAALYQARDVNPRRDNFDWDA